MLELDRRLGIFKLKERWFCDYPSDVLGCDSVVFYGCKNFVSQDGFQHKEFNTSMVDLSGDLGTIWERTSSGNCRKAVKRAERDSIVVKMNHGYEAFYEMYRTIRQKYSVDSLTLEEIRKYATLFVAEHEGKIISGHGYLEDAENIRSWVIGSRRFEGDKEYATLVANASKLIIWNAIKYAHSKGIKYMDMGGIYAGENLTEQQLRFNTFKESFGGKVVTTHTYQKDYSILLKIARKVRGR